VQQLKFQLASKQLSLFNFALIEHSVTVTQRRAFTQRCAFAKKVVHGTDFKTQ